MDNSFLVYKQARYLKLAVLLSTVSITAYFVHEPYQSSNGGTWLGYTLGTIGVCLIVWLMWFGIRKRSYHSNLGSVREWLSAHVYLGLSLLIIATLHTGFQLGWNVHTLSYFLLCLVISSGIWGAYTYLRYPGLIYKNRHNASREMLFQDLDKINQNILKVALKLNTDLRELVVSADNRTELGGGLWAQLGGKDHSKLILPVGVGSNTKLVANKDQKKLIEILADKQAHSKNSQETAHIHEILEFLNIKVTLLRKLRSDIQFQGQLQIWLFLHVPLSFALLAALSAHIIFVFIYW